MENKVWEFVEKYYPNYSTSEGIAYNGDLLKVVERECSYGDRAHNLYKELCKECAIDLYGSNMKPYTTHVFDAAEIKAKSLYQATLIEIYETAIQSHLDHISKIRNGEY